MPGLRLEAGSGVCRRIIVSDFVEKKLSEDVGVVHLFTWYTNVLFYVVSDV